ncbi:MAG: hypothetical protein IKN49_07525 [Elusimicrobiaceae bacterium]|nr:hypothetical protein [Elusimicrobiaceae bacterium]
MTNKYGLTIVKDYPIKGVNFIDINGLLATPHYFTAVIEKFCETIKQSLPAEQLKQAAIITPESRGFVFSAPVADRLKLPLLLIRKNGKIPNNPYSFRITNEYSTYNMEMDGDLLEKHNHFIYIDDILATGQTLASVRNAIGKKGKEVVLAVHLTAVTDLKPMRDENIDLKGLPTKEII